jgi:ribose/xylose/arabinose/galactoside ABC-type transport system permease subunit
LVLIGIGLVFEVFGWIVRDQSFLMNSQRLVLMILQVSIIGLLAIGVTQVIITTGSTCLRLGAGVVGDDRRQSGANFGFFPRGVSQPD